MANISKIKLPSGSQYNVKDARFPQATSSDSGKTYVVQSDGTLTLQTAAGGNVDDVKANGTSVVTNKVADVSPNTIGAATSAQGLKADSAVQTIQIGGAAQTKTSGVVNLPAYPTKSSLDLGNVENKSSATIRGEITSSNVTTALGYTPLNSTLKGANSGVAELDANGKVPSSQLPSYVDDVLEYDTQSSFPATGETGKIYIAKDTNKTYRWSGSAYVEISASLALGTTSSTAFRGDYGNTAYSHASAKGSAFSSGMYKITTNAEGHVTAATAIAKADITGLGIPAQDTTYTFDGTYNASTNKAATVSTVTNAIAGLDGSVSGTPGADKTLTAFSETDGKVSATFGNISITKSQISDFPTIPAAQVQSDWNAASGMGAILNKPTLGGAASKGVVTTVDTSANLPTSNAVKTFVEGKGYTTNVGTITGITMNGASKGTSGVIDLGTVITSHQNISGKIDNPSTKSSGQVLTYNGTTWVAADPQGGGGNVTLEQVQTLVSNAITSAMGYVDEQVMDAIEGSY